VLGFRITNELQHTVAQTSLEQKAIRRLAMEATSPRHILLPLDFPHPAADGAEPEAGDYPDLSKVKVKGVLLRP